MELNDLNSMKRSSSLNKLLNTRFGFQLELDKMNDQRAKRVLDGIERQIEESKQGVGPYQTNKKYMASKLAKETVEAWMVENKLSIEVAEDDKANIEPGDGAINPQQEVPAADAKRNQALRMLVGTQNFPKAKRALELYKQGKTVPPTLMAGFMPVIDIVDEIMSSGMANLRMLQMINKRAKKSLGISESVLKEGEMESAELVLASKDMVDRIQGMLEDVGEMMNEELLPLTDSIRDEMGNEKAEAFSNAAKSALETFLDAVTQARTDLDSASRILIGDEAPVPAVDLSTDAPADDIGVGDDDLDLDLDAGEPGQEGAGELDREERI